LALQKVSQQASSDQESQTCSISKTLSKPQAGFSSQNPLLALQSQKNTYFQIKITIYFYNSLSKHFNYGRRFLP
jgi:hypothetical protein